MSAVPTELPQDPETTDRIAWRQILVGYGIVLMTAAAVVGSTLFAPNDFKLLVSPLVVVFVALAMVFRKPAEKLHGTYLARHPFLEDCLQWAAIVLLALLGLVTIALAVVLFPAQSA